MNREEALDKFESFYTTDEINNFIEKIYKEDFIITKSEPILKIHVEAMDMSEFTEEFIRKEIVPEIVKVLKSGCSRLIDVVDL